MTTCPSRRTRWAEVASGSAAPKGPRGLLTRQAGAERLKLGISPPLGCGGQFAWYFMQRTVSPIQAMLASGGAGTGVSSRPRQAGVREQFLAEELAIVLSHFDIGVIDSITEYPRGSRKAPKLLVVSAQGKFLLKRRARGKDDPYKVAFSHSVQLFLAQRQFPLPHLIGTRNDNNSMLQWRNGVYELFEYIPGQSYPQTLEATVEGGQILARFHKLLQGFTSEWQPSPGSYHKAPAVAKGLESILHGLPADDKETRASLGALVSSYQAASDTVEAAGYGAWPKQIIHADWHPGNMLFRENQVAAVIDYDSVRALPRIIDVANGALQFSIIGGDEDLTKWPEYLDETRFRRFLRGYDEVMLLSEAEIKLIPPLMVEALIAEAVFPIAATGSFGRMEGMAFLRMVHKKITWILRHADRLVEVASG